MPHHTEWGSTGIPGITHDGMETALYTLAEILVCDPVASSRANTRSALHSLGCRQIEMVSSLPDFMTALEHRPPDLAICDALIGEGELVAAIRQLRWDEQTYNPFVIIIVTSWTTSATRTSELLNAGIDGLLLRPFSAAMLDQRIRTHVLRQKPFIVSDNYIGPSRRAQERPTPGAFSLDPPNSLKAKLDGRENPDEAMRGFKTELRATREKLSARKRQRNVPTNFENAI